VGGNVLQIFAEVASAKLGPYDLIGRLDGEEFAIVIYDSGRDKGLAIAERIRLSFETAAADIEGRPIGSTFSMGMAIAETNLFDIAAQLAQADEALYCAKERGRNRTEVASLQLVLDRAQEAEQRGRPRPVAAASAPSAA
jgi:diguanylate cyclase (GGDEF)-like protein